MSTGERLNVKKRPKVDPGGRGDTGVRGEENRGRMDALLTRAIDSGGPLDAALLLKRTGVVLAAWTRDEVPEEVASVMAATLAGSVEMIAEALGGPSPSSFTVDMASRHLLAVRVDPHRLLVLVGSPAHSDALRAAADRILSALGPGGAEAAQERSPRRVAQARGSR